MNTTLYRVASVMTTLDCSRATVYRMIARGDLEKVTISIGGTRITGASLERVVAAGCQ